MIHPIEQSLRGLIEIWLRQNFGWYECTAFETASAAKPDTREALKSVVNGHIIAEIKDHIVYEERLEDGKFYLQGKIWIPRRTPYEALGSLQG